MAKKYYWLKLNVNFFNSPEIKILRRVAGGDTYTLIYLEMLLLSLENEGKLYFEGVGEDLSDEVAAVLNEKKEDVHFLMIFLQKKGLIEVSETQEEYYLSNIEKMIGSESESTERVRKMRERKKLQALQCNTDVTESNTEKRRVEKEIELEKDVVREKEKKENNNDNSFSLIYKFWEENGFGIMQPITIQKMQRWLADFNDNHEMILKALEVTVEQGSDKCNFGYVNRILQNWTNRKFETVEQVEAAEQQRNQTKQPKNSQSNKPDIIPDWLEKQIAEEQEQTAGVVKPVIVKEKTEIKTDPAMLERIAQFRKELKESAQ